MNDTQSIQVKLPIGRLVQGSLYEYSPVRNIADSTRAKQYFFSLAIPKSGSADWKTTPWGSEIYRYVQAAFPQGEYARPTFSWKIIDGDQSIPNAAGTIPCQQPGFKGCWIVKSASTFVSKVLDVTDPAQISLITEPGYVKRGDYVEGVLIVRRNRQPKSGDTNMHIPGLYLYISHVGFRARGEEIAYLPYVDVSSIGFGQEPLPEGATVVTPPNSVGVSMFSGESQPAPLPPAHHGILQGVNTPRVMTAAATMPYEEYKKLGLTDDALITAGLMAPL